MKFGGNRLLLDGFVEVKSKEEADEVPLAKALYDEFKFVKEVFVSENFVAVTKDDSVQWHEVMTVVRNVIAEFLQNGNKITNKEPQKHESPVEKSSTENILMMNKKFRIF
jgi:hypothetical protein